MIFEKIVRIDPIVLGYLGYGRISVIAASDVEKLFILCSNIALVPVRSQIPKFLIFNFFKGRAARDHPDNHSPVLPDRSDLPRRPRSLRCLPLPPKMDFGKIRENR